MEITLERWKSDDYPAFFMASNDEALRANMSDAFPKTLDECKRVVDAFSKSMDTTEYVRAIKLDRRIIGCIAAFFESDMYGKNAEIAYWLNADYRGKGIMPRVIKSFTRELFSVFGLHRIWARPFERNRASHRALEKAGFSYEGVMNQDVIKDGVYIVSVIYALIKD